ncbi:peptide chain release factor N(5)-glutamine methyltransferase [Cognatilysobacter bugurensis]|nr:peptide chain release factor N(5)-glutamine methyltransferase [Lysobacter bugurensis]
MRIDPADSELLLAHVLERPRSWLFAHADATPSGDERERFEDVVARRARGEPVAYITGLRGFWSFDLAVTPATLIPRPETELLVELALARLPDGTALDVADLGTGSGAVALAIASERPEARVIATDASAAALEVARSNANRLRLTNVRFALGDWCTPLADARFDVIVSNPPYIAEHDRHLVEGDLRYEPPSALASGADGLDAIRTIARDAFGRTRPGGWLLLEHGFDQGAAVRAVLQEAGWCDVETARDLEHRDRVTFGRRN